MSKERLEEIKTSTWNICECETCYCENFKPQMIAVEPKHFDWLIEQAERAQELEETNKKNYWIAADFKFENLQLEQQNKRYREALEEIKKEETVTTALSEGQVAYTISGHIARKALEVGNND